MTSGGTTIADIMRASWVNLAAGQPGQARNFFLKRFIEGSSPTLYGRDYIAGSITLAAPDVTVDVSTAGEIGVTVNNTPVAPAGYTDFADVAFSIMTGQSLTDRDVPVTDFEAMGAAAGTTITFTGLTAADVYEVQTATVFTADSDEANERLIRVSQSDIQDATVT